MRFWFFFLFFFAECLVVAGIEIQVGSKTIATTEENVFEWEQGLIILSKYSESLQIEGPTVGTLGSFEYLVWNNHTIGYSEISGLITIDGVSSNIDQLTYEEVLKSLEIPYAELGTSLILPEGMISTVSYREGILEIAYLGSFEFVASVADEYIEVVSLSWSAYEDRMFSPGEDILKIHVGENWSVERTVEFEGFARVILTRKNYRNQNVVLIPLSEAATTQIGDDTIPVFWGIGDNRILMRGYSSDFEGADWSVYAENKHLAEKLAEEHDLKLEICPLIFMPVARISFTLLLENEDYVIPILNSLRELLK